jgi:hypothetical protein
VLYVDVRGTQPRLGDVFPVVTSDLPIRGSFDDVIVSGLSDDKAFQVIQTSKQIALKAVPASDLSLRLTAPSRSPKGDIFRVTATITDLGPADALRSRFGLAVDSYHDFVSATTDQGSCARALDNGFLVCRLGTIAEGDSVTIRVSLRGTRTGNTSVTAHAITDSGLDSNRDNDSVGRQILIIP